MYDRYLYVVGRIEAWASGEPGIRAVAVVGSQMQTSPGPDEWSDLDLVLFARDPDRYERDQGWIRAIDANTVCFTEHLTVAEGQEVRVLFRGDLDVDFVFCSVSSISRIIESPTEADIFSRGWLILLDKDGDLTSTLSGLAHQEGGHSRLPTIGTFLNLVSDFHYHVVWAAKKLARGELLVAWECLDGYLRQLYLQCCAWEAITRGSSPPQLRLSRFFESWASETAITGMAALCVHYKAQEVAGALRAAATAFSKIAAVVAEAVGAAYPTETEQAIGRTVARILTMDSSGPHRFRENTGSQSRTE